MTAPMPREKLLPCPFCAGPAEYFLNPSRGDNSMARCRCCGAEVFGLKWNIRDPGVAQTAPSAVVVEALDNSQSLLVMVFHLAETNDGGIPALDWANEDLSKLVTEQIAENRGALSNQGASK